MSLYTKIALRLPERHDFPASKSFTLESLEITPAEVYDQYPNIVASIEYICDDGTVLEAVFEEECPIQSYFSSMNPLIRKWMAIKLYCYDPSMAPSDKSVDTASFMFASYGYWKRLSADRERYTGDWRGSCVG